MASGGHLQFSSSSCPVLTALATAAPRAREVCKVFFEVRSFSPSFIHSFFPPDTGARAKVAGPTRMSLEFHNLPLLCCPQAGPLVAACPLGLSGTGVFQSPLFERVRGAAGDGRRGGGGRVPLGARATATLCRAQPGGRARGWGGGVPGSWAWSHWEVWAPFSLPHRFALSPPGAWVPSDKMTSVLRRFFPLLSRPPAPRTPLWLERLQDLVPRSAGEEGYVGVGGRGPLAGGGVESLGENRGEGDISWAQAAHRGWELRVGIPWRRAGGAVPLGARPTWTLRGAQLRPGLGAGTRAPGRGDARTGCHPGENPGGETAGLRSGRLAPSPRRTPPSPRPFPSRVPGRPSPPRVPSARSARRPGEVDCRGCGRGQGSRPRRRPRSADPGFAERPRPGRSPGAVGGTAAGRLGWPSDGGGRSGAGLRRRQDKGRGESGPAAGPPGSGAGRGARGAGRGVRGAGSGARGAGRGVPGAGREWAWVLPRPAPAKEAG